ncbi:MAG TPA: tetratricopeptide repeat protein [Paludibacter sp.]|nr:tetratricopeptide repeat protein [Paludibacter sp.]
MKFKLIFLFPFFCLSLFAKSADGGDVFFNNKQYVKARAVYESALKKKPKDALYNYRYARCCYELKDYDNAITHFELSGSKFPMRDLYLGELYFNTYRFDQSVTAYQAYISTLKPDDSKIPEYQQKMKQAENAARLLTKVEDIAIVDSVVVSKSDFLKFYKFSSELGSLSQEPIKITAHRTVDKIKYTTQRQDRIYYSDSIHGQMDIFTSYKLLDDWSAPTSISPLINTSANENYPFLLLDGVTVYFASDGENSIGGYDLFVTRFNPSTDSYLAPENIGFPFNSFANDYMMVIDEQRHLGWFATDRNQRVGNVVIYTFIPNETKTIIHSDDKDYVRRAAQLKTYRKVTAIVAESDSASQNQVKKTEGQIEFVINDSIVYTNVKQFKSDGALKLWIEMRKFSAEIKALKTQLSDLRTKYANAQNEGDKATLAPQILELETKIAEQQKQISLKAIQIRKEEILFYQNSK